MFQQTLNPYERAQFFLVGEFIYIDTAPATVRVTTKRGSYELAQGAQVIDASADGGDVYLELTGDQAGLVRVISGYGRYVPPADGQKVDVSSLPAVAFDGAQPVTLDALPRMRFDGAQPVAFDGAQPVTLNALPPVALEAGQTVEVHSGHHALWVYQRANRTFTQQTATLDNVATVIASNPERSRIELAAPAANTADVVIYPSADDAAQSTNGLTLGAGFSLSLDVYGELHLNGAAADTVIYTEYLR